MLKSLASRVHLSSFGKRPRIIYATSKNFASSSQFAQGSEYWEEKSKESKRGSRPIGSKDMILAGTVLAAGFYGYAQYVRTIEPEVPKEEAAPQTTIEKTSAKIKSWIDYWVEPVTEKLLPDLDPTAEKKPVLVVDLDKILIHTTWDHKNRWRIQKRPFLDEFLATIPQLYELVIYSEKSQGYVWPIMGKLNNIVEQDHILTRENTKYLKGAHVKDLSKLNRELSQVLIMDCDPASVQLQPENAVVLKPWTGDLEDTDLLDTTYFLLEVSKSKVKDVRETLKIFDGKDIPTVVRQARIKNFEERQQKQEQKQKAKSGKSVFARH